MFQVKHDDRPRIPTRDEWDYCMKRELDNAFEPARKRPKEFRLTQRQRQRLNSDFPHSNYVGVRWNDECKKWYASLHANGKHHYCGLYEDEGDAARAVNAKCEHLSIPHKNKGIGVIPIRKKNKRSSRKSVYKGIYWVEKSQSWQVKIKYQKKLHSGGTFQDELLAAQAANLLCVKLQIPQKNAGIGVHDILQELRDGKIPHRRPRSRRKSKNEWMPKFSKVKRDQGSAFPSIQMPTLYPSNHSPKSGSSLLAMTPSQVADWLRDLRFLDKYIDQFVKCEISGVELLNLDEVLLTDFGLPKLFQKRLLSAIADLMKNGFHQHLLSQKETLVRKLGTVKPQILEHLSLFDGHNSTEQDSTVPSPLASTPVDCNGLAVSTPVKLEVIPRYENAPPALEIPQIKQEKIDEQVLNTWQYGSFMPILETKANDVVTLENPPEPLINEPGQIDEWKRMGTSIRSPIQPDDDISEPSCKAQGYGVHKEHLQSKSKQKPESKRKRLRPRRKTNEMFEIDWLPLCDMRL